MSRSDAEQALTIILTLSTRYRRPYPWKGIEVTIRTAFLERQNNKMRRLDQHVIHKVSLVKGPFTGQVLPCESAVCTMLHACSHSNATQSLDRMALMIHHEGLSCHCKCTVVDDVSHVKSFQQRTDTVCSASGNKEHVPPRERRPLHNNYSNNYSPLLAHSPST